MSRFEVMRVMKSKTCDRIATLFFWAVALISLSVLGFIVVVILTRGIGTAIDTSFIFGKPEAMKEGGGIYPMIVSSFYLAFLTITFAVPVSIGAAIYLAEYSDQGRFVKAVRFSADSLSSLPSIVFGLFGMAFFVVRLGWGYCLLAGAGTLALLNLPTLMRTAEEAILSVPSSLREASLGLGASRWQTVKRVVLPSSMPGIVTGIVLTLGRILGESAAIVYTAGLFVRRIPISPFDNSAPISAYLWYVQTEALVPDYRSIVDGGAALLLIIILSLNLLARLFAGIYRKKQGMAT